VTQPASTDSPELPLTEPDADLWAAFAHLGGVVGFLPSLVIHLAFRKRSTHVATESAEALSWQLTWLSVWLAVVVVGFFATMLGADALSIFVIGVLWLLYLVNVAFSVVAFAKTNHGGSYRYPVNFRWVR
jgi:hypothetical protein